MRKLLLGPLAAIALFVTPNVAAAIEGPWCARANVGWGFVSEICHFTTFEACRREASMWGPTSHCTQNPRYLPYWHARGYGAEPGPAPRKRKARRY